MRRTILALLAAACLLSFAPSAFARGGTYTVAGGTAEEQATVHAALDASSFDWGLLPSVSIQVGIYGTSYSTYGHVYLDAKLLDSGIFSWGVVQHELAHQVDFFLLDDAKRQLLQRRLGGKDWCYTTPGLQHADHGCERFASELAWAYWPSPQNSMRPSVNGDESTGMPVADFRVLLGQLIGAPTTVATPLPTKAFAPTPKHKKKR
jgi:hypothetical protein